MNFTFCFADRPNEWNTSAWRAHIPSNGLNTQPDKHSAKCIPLSDFAHYGNPTVQKIVGRSEVIIVQRNLLTPQIWEACDYWRGLGRLVVADLDDDYPHLTPQNPAYPFWIEDKTGLEKATGRTPVEALTEGFRHVDALVSPNRRILETWQDVVPGYWLPNYAYGEWYKDVRQKPAPQRDERIIIGWGGSVSHWDGFWFSGLVQAMQAITEKHPRVLWKLCGNDERVKKLFAEMLPEDRWIHQPGVPPDKWPLQVASFDIGLAPLCGPDAPQSESYDQHRSWLKALEYALCGVPWVGSSGGVYDELEPHTTGFCVENTAEAWTRTLERIVNGLDGYKRAAKRRMTWARKNLIMENVIDKYVKVFETIAAERNASLGLKLPNALYSKDVFDQIEEQDLPGVVVQDADIDLLLECQQGTFDLSQMWHTDLSLVSNGVNLGEVMQYQFLHTLNAQTFEEVTHV